MFPVFNWHQDAKYFISLLITTLQNEKQTNLRLLLVFHYHVFLLHLVHGRCGCSQFGVFFPILWTKIQFSLEPLKLQRPQCNVTLPYSLKDRYAEDATWSLSEQATNYVLPHLFDPQGRYINSLYSFQVRKHRERSNPRKYMTSRELKALPWHELHIPFCLQFPTCLSPS